jgi:TonB family protein
MDIGLGLTQPAPRPSSKGLPGPRFLVQLEPPHRVFLGNLLDIVLIRHRGKTAASSRTAPFWPDVFVPSHTPWLGFLESLLYHAIAIAAVWTLSQVWVTRPQLQVASSFSRSNVIYYTPSEYLPPLDTGSAPARRPQKGDPEFARQEIISVPAEADNHTQTIVTPPDIKLNHDVPVPNIVAWNEVAPAVPMAATERSRMPAPSVRRTVVAPAPVLENVGLRRADSGPSEVVAPPPDVTAIQSQRDLIPGRGTAVIAPPPTIQESTRKWGDLNIGKSEVVAPAPELPLGEQRATAGALQAAMGGSSTRIVPPAPSVPAGSSIGRRAAAGAGTGVASGAGVVPPPPSSKGMDTAAGGRIIALGIHPIAGPPPSDLAGNRRGSFAATPRGKPGAAGTPDVAAAARSDGQGGQGHGNGGGAGISADTAKGAPAGLHVGPGSSAGSASPVTGGDPAETGSSWSIGKKDPSTVSPNLIADNRPMRVTVTPGRSLPNSPPPTEAERRVFGDRKSYAMILNMPNLNSAGGSWIIRFAELKQSEEKGDLSAPEATHKVDPGYPLELMRQNVRGTVTLYAVIRSDGSVGDVRVLSSPDERLDRYAASALTHWRFRPATKDGKPVTLEAVVSIPFRPTRGF